MMPRETLAESWMGLRSGKSMEEIRLFFLTPIGQNVSRVFRTGYWYWKRRIDDSKMKQIISTICFVNPAGVVIFCAALFPQIVALAADPPRVEENGTIHVPAFDLPESSFLDEE